MLVFLACVGIVIVSSIGLNRQVDLRAQEEIVFPQIGDEAAAAREVEKEVRRRKETPETSDDFATQADMSGKEHGCRVERSYKCKDRDCEKEYRSKCYERGM